MIENENYNLEKNNEEKMFKRNMSKLFLLAIILLVICFIVASIQSYGFGILTDFYDFNEFILDCIFDILWCLFFYYFGIIKFKKWANVLGAIRMIWFIISYIIYIDFAFVLLGILSYVLIMVMHYKAYKFIVLCKQK